MASPKGKSRFLVVAIFGRTAVPSKRFHHKCSYAYDDSRAIDSFFTKTMTSGNVGKARRERTNVISSFVLILLARDSFGRCDPRVPLRILPHHFSTQFRSENIRPREATIRTSRHIQPTYRCRCCSSASQPARRLERTLVFVSTVKLEVMSTESSTRC